VGCTGATVGSIFWSQDGGANWFDFSAGPGQTHVNSLAVLLDGAGRYVIAGTDKGVLVRGPGDVAFNPLASGRPAVPVYALALNTGNGKLYAGTHGREVWALEPACTITTS